MKFGCQGGPNVSGQEEEFRKSISHKFRGKKILTLEGELNKSLPSQLILVGDFSAEDEEGPAYTTVAYIKTPPTGQEREESGSE